MKTVHHVSSSCRRKTVLSASLLLTLGIALLSIVPVSLVYAQTTMYMDPSDNVFDVATTPIGYKWNITFYVQDVADLFGYQVALYYESTMINVTNAWLPTWDTEWVFNSKTTVKPPPVIRPLNETHNQVWIGDTILIGTTFTGSGRVAIIEFQIINAPPKRDVSIVLNINNPDTYLLDSTAKREIPTAKIDGSFTYTCPVISVINSKTGDNNFIFYKNTTTVGHKFNATAWVYNITDLFAYNVKLTYNSSLLKVIDAWLPNWDTEWVFYGRSTSMGAPLINNFEGHVIIGDDISNGPTFNGTGKLAIIEFQIIYTPTTRNVSCSLNITHSDTYPMNSNQDVIATIKLNGQYEFNYVPSIITINVNPTSIKVGSTVTISGTITPIRQDVNVSIYYKFPDEAWTNLTTVKTNSNSQFTYLWTPVNAGTYEVKSSWPGDEITWGAESDVATLEVQPTGTLIVMTSPVSAEVFVNGTSWGTAPQTRVVEVGTYNVSFKDIAGYYTPSWQLATVQEGIETVVTGVYEPITGNLTITTTPVSGELFVNGTSWGLAPQSRVIQIGTYNVSFGPVAGYYTPAWQLVTVSENVETTVTGVYEPIFGAIDGTVTDASTGLPISGASITANVYSATTDVDGYYIIVAVLPGDYTVTATAAGYSSDSRSTYVKSNMTTTVDFALEPVAHTLKVDSNPISGVNFTVDSTLHTTPWSDSLREGSYTIEMPSTWTVGADEYTFDHWEDNSTEPTRIISLTKDTTLTATYELYVPPPGWIDGYVIDASTGAALVGATVIADGIHATTDTTGYYNIETMPGTYTVTASLTGYLDAVVTSVAVAAGETTLVNFTLTRIPETGTISGTVTDVSIGEPIAGATVSVDTTYSAFTDSLGVYIIDNVSPGEYTIAVSALGYVGKSKTATVIAGETTIVNFVLASIPPTGTLSVITTPVTGEVFVNGTSWGFAPQSRVVDVGIYNVSFGLVAGYYTPAWQLVTVKEDAETIVTGVYEPIRGTLTVTTSPVSGEVFVDGISWGIAPQSKVVQIGTYNVSFGAVVGYYTPAWQLVTVSENVESSVNGTYTPITGTLTITTTPIAAKVFVNGTSWGIAPQSRVVQIGTYIVTFGEVEDYYTPADQVASVYENVETTVKGIYELVPGIVIAEITNPELVNVTSPFLVNATEEAATSLFISEISDPVTIIVKNVTDPDVNPPPGTWKILSNYVQITVNNTGITVNATIRIYYTLDQLQEAGLDESTLKIHYWNATSGEWVAVESHINTEEHYVWANINHFSIWITMGQAQAPPPTTPLWWLWVVFAFLATIAIVATAIYIRKRK